MPQQLTPSKKQDMEDYVDGWFRECKRWAEDFDDFANKFTHEWLQMQEGVPSIKNVEMAAVYFLVAAGCVRLHCVNIVEAKLESRDVEEWLREEHEKLPMIKVLAKRRNRINHGPNDRDDMPVFRVHRTIPWEEILDRAVTEREGDIYETVIFSWANESGQVLDNVSEWQKSVLLELGKMIDDVKEIPW